MGLTLICPAWETEEEPRSCIVWQVAYSAFNRFRQEIAAAAGGSYPPHRRDPNNPDSYNDLRYWLGKEYTREKAPGLHAFMEHSDCYGEIDPETCLRIAKEMKALAPAIRDRGTLSHGHVQRCGGYYEMTYQLIRACRACAERGVSLQFR